MTMKCGDFPSTRFALYVRQIANGHEKPKANSIANSSISAAMFSIRQVHFWKGALPQNAFLI